MAHVAAIRSGTAAALAAAGLAACGAKSAVEAPNGPSTQSHRPLAAALATAEVRAQLNLFTGRQDAFCAALAPRAQAGLARARRARTCRAAVRSVPAEHGLPARGLRLIIAQSVRGATAARDGTDAILRFGRVRTRFVPIAGHWEIADVPRIHITRQRGPIANGGYSADDAAWIDWGR